MKNYGYEITNHNMSDEQPKPNEWTTQDEPYISYRAENETALEEIEFRLYGKNVWFKGFRKDIGRLTPCPINMQELKAINMKCKELRLGGIIYENNRQANKKIRI